MQPIADMTGKIIEKTTHNFQNIMGQIGNPKDLTLDEAKIIAAQGARWGGNIASSGFSSLYSGILTTVEKTQDLYNSYVNPKKPTFLEQLLTASFKESNEFYGIYHDDLDKTITKYLCFQNKEWQISYKKWRETCQSLQIDPLHSFRPYGEQKHTYSRFVYYKAPIEIFQKFSNQLDNLSETVQKLEEIAEIEKKIYKISEKIIRFRSELEKNKNKFLEQEINRFEQKIQWYKKEKEKRIQNL